jgi:hypothetical protein
MECFLAKRVRLEHTPGPSVIKHFTSVIYECLYKAQVFVLVRSLQLSLMFVGKARSPPLIEAPERCFTRVGSVIVANIKWAGNKHSSLQQIFLNYVCKKLLQNWALWGTPSDPAQA